MTLEQQLALAVKQNHELRERLLEQQQLINDYITATQANVSYAIRPERDPVSGVRPAKTERHSRVVRPSPSTIQLQDWRGVARSNG